MSTRRLSSSPRKMNVRVVKPEPIEPSLSSSPTKAGRQGSSVEIKGSIFVKSEGSDPSLPYSKAVLSPSRLSNIKSVTSSPHLGPSDRKDVTFPSQPAVAGAPLNFVEYDSAAEIQYTPELALKTGLSMVENIKAHVLRIELGSKLRKDVWLKEIKSLENQASPTTMIAVCGGTGTGKSSLLNAILDDNIVPTSGMRACTAVVTEIAYHKDKFIAADVSFLSEKEWRDELSILLDDLKDEDGSIKRTSDLRNEAGVAWHKVHAVYPSLTQDRLARINTVDELISLDPNIAKQLGSVKKIKTADSKQFAKEISKFIDSKDQKRGHKKDKEKKKEDNGPALWPLIRQVNVRCPSEALRTGAILVDLPGVADANAARSNIAKDYMKKCDCIWVVAPITRAVDDKTAKDLLGDAFRSQLMNGGFSDIEGTISFIATKCDDVSCQEVINSLELDNEPELQEIESRLDQIHDESREWKEKKTNAERAAKQISKELEDIRASITEHQEHIKALEEGKPYEAKAMGRNKKGTKRKNSRGGKNGSPKRRKTNESGAEDGLMSDEERDEMLLDPEADLDMDDDMDDFIDARSVVSDGSNDDSDSDSDNEHSDKSQSDAEDEEEAVEQVEEDLTIDDIKAKLEGKKEELKDARVRLSEARRLRKEAMDAMSALSKTKADAQRGKNGFCSLKRSEFSRDVLKEDFRSGLKELDDAAAEKMDPNNFDPTINLRDYENIHLPTFTVSARDYVRIKKQIKGDGDPTCFTNVVDTGIPELQKWCQTLTVKSRERAAKAFRNHIRVFATSVKSYIDSIGAISEGDREKLRNEWQSEQPEELYTMDDDYGDDDDDDQDDGIDWVYQGGRLIPMLREPRFSSSTVVSTDVGKNGKDEHGISQRLSKMLQTIVQASVKDMQNLFKEGLEDKCHVGATKASECAVETSDSFAASMHWATYRATLRRDGEWRRNLNEELITPMTRVLAASWAQIFESDLLSSFEKKAVQALESLLSEFELSCPGGLRDRARQQGQVCLEAARVALRSTIDIVNAQLTAGQKDVSRCLTPTVREQMLDGYQRAMEERGRGSVARQKTVMHNYVSTNKHDLFEHGTDALFDGLDKIAEAVGVALEDALKDLADKVEVNLAVLWENVSSDSLSLAHDRHQAVANIDKILVQLSLWDDADKMRG